MVIGKSIPIIIGFIAAIQYSATLAYAQRLDLAPTITKKVLVIEYNPILENHGNVRLNQYFNWNNPQTLEKQYIHDLKTSSSGVANYHIVDRKIIDDIPQKVDGFNYTDETFIQCWNNRSTCHTPDGVDYNKILKDFQVCEQFNQGQIDELWLWGGPYFGYYESRMTGPNAFYVNSPPLSGSTCNKRMVIMGFNYERSSQEMIHNMGHRVESTMTHLFGGWQQNRISNDWEKFALVEAQSPNFNYSGCGSTHFPPNGNSDYDYDNPNPNKSTCLDFENYPNLTGTQTNIDCKLWNCHTFEKWWHSFIPKFLGKKDGKWNNWWYYILDYDSAANPSAQATILGRIVIDQNQNGINDEDDIFSIQTPGNLCGNEYTNWPNAITIEYGGPQSSIQHNTINNAQPGCNPPYFARNGLQPGTYALKVTGISGYQLSGITGNHCIITSTTTATCTLKAGNNHTWFLITPNIPQAPPNPADYDQDGDVDLTDLQKLLSHFKTNSTTYNLLGTTVIDIFDFNYLLKNFTP